MRMLLYVRENIEGKGYISSIFRIPSSGKNLNQIHAYCINPVLIFTKKLPVTIVFAMKMKEPRGMFLPALQVDC